MRPRALWPNRFLCRLASISRFRDEERRSYYDFDTLALDLARGMPRRAALRQLGGALAAGLIVEITDFLALAPTPAAAATAAPSPCDSSKALTCLNQVQAAFAAILAGCAPATVDQGSLAYWLADDRCLDSAAQGYQRDQGQCLGAGCPAGSVCSQDLCCPAGAVGCGGVCCGAGQGCVNGACSGGASGGTGPNCAAGLTACGGACVNLQTDAANCGSCGHACAGGQNCAGGQCAAGCAAGLTLCGGACVNLQSDAANCGSCGKACGSGLLCGQGRCLPPCPAGLTVCGTTCVDLQRDPNNCGGCGRTCGSGVCAGGGCAAARLDSPCTACGSACVNLQSDPSHCGACGSACRTAPAEVCLGGTCQPPVNTTGGGSGPSVNCAACANICVDLQSDPLHCGNCFDQCAAGASCVNGSCACPAGSPVVCFEVGYYYSGYVCTNLQSDAGHCGSCGNQCAQGQSCVDGACACPAGQAVCPVLDRSTGFDVYQCIDIQTDSHNCGACGNVCATSAYPNPLPCAGGVCVCPTAGETYCPFTGNGTGYCVDLQTNAGNCGACYNQCGPSAHCAGGQCVCSTPGQTYCQRACVDLQTDANNCGACGRVCAAGQTCNGGQCGCPSGQTLCSGTCTDTQTDRNNCGACGHQCSAIRAEVCEGGRCGPPPIQGCPADRPTLCPSGACVNVQSDANNCGACGHVCPTGTTCDNGVCTCPSAQPDVCSGACVSLQSNPYNCGACGHVCATGQNCSGGTCVCPSGLTLCSGTCTDTQTDRNNCGGCGNRCGSAVRPGSCTGGKCGPPSIA